MSAAPEARPIAEAAQTIAYSAPQVEDRSRSETRFLFSAMLPVDLRFDKTGLANGMLPPGVIQPIVDYTYACPDVDAVNDAFTNMEAKMRPEGKPFKRTAATIVERVLDTHAKEGGIEGTSIGLVELRPLQGLEVWRRAEDKALWQAIQMTLWPANHPTYQAQYDALKAVSLDEIRFGEFGDHIEMFEGVLALLFEALDLAAAYGMRKRGELTEEQTLAARNFKGNRSLPWPQDLRVLNWLGAAAPVKAAQPPLPSALGINPELERVVGAFTEGATILRDMTADKIGSALSDERMGQLIEQLTLQSAQTQQLITMLASGRGVAVVNPLETSGTDPVTVADETSTFTEDSPAVFDDEPRVVAAVDTPVAEVSQPDGGVASPKPQVNGKKKNGK